MPVDLSPDPGPGRADRPRLGLGSPITLVAVGGTLLLGVYILAQGVPTRDWIELVLLAVGVVLLGAVASHLLLSWARERSLGIQVAVVTAAPLAAVLVGTAIGAKTTFISRHDLTTIAVLLIAAGTTGCISALLLGQRLAGASHDLRRAAQQLGDGEPVSAASSRGEARELAHLRADLELAAERLDDARRRQRALEASRRDLIGWVAHDLRDPVASIRRVAEEINADDGASPEVRARGVEISAQATRLADLLDDLLELSDAQARQDPPAVDPAPQLTR